MKTLLLIALFTLPVWGDCSDRIVVAGQVLRSDNRGVPRATITFVKGFAIYKARSNPFGLFSIRIPFCGQYEITATAKNREFETQSLWLPIADMDSYFITIHAL